jgi:precorrin-2/cobalt-factor-2 C20-methyltransferase
MKKLYGIGVGPGDPELITIKGVNVLKKVSAIITPQGKKGEESIALNIAKPYIRENVHVESLVFPMTRDPEALELAWEENRRRIENLLESYGEVAFLTLGDPSVFSTYMYMVPRLLEKNILVETIPGITAFSALGSAINKSLTLDTESLGVYPMKKNGEGLRSALNAFDNLVVMKVSTDPKAIGVVLKEQGLERNFVIISHVSQQEQHISYDISKLIKGQVPYLSTMLIKKKEVFQ